MKTGASSRDAARKAFAWTRIPAAVPLVLLAVTLLPTLTAFRHRERRSLCEAHLRQIGRAMIWYRHEWGVPPRSFDALDRACRRLSGESAPIALPDLYRCPEESPADRGEISSYQYRLPADAPAAFVPAAHPSPDSVLVYCAAHVRPNPFYRHDRQTGDYLVLRASGQVDRVPARIVRTYRYRSGRWLPEGSPPRFDDAERDWDVFPGETRPTLRRP